jgi:ankyrin repeat protein
MSHPSTLQLVRQQSIDHQIIYTIFHRLINDSYAVQVLDEPETELDRLFKAGVIHFFSLGKRTLTSLVNSTPPPYNQALKQNTFRAALVLGNGSVLSDILEMNQTNLANQILVIGSRQHYPLEYASHKGHIQATKALLDHGADPNYQTPTFTYLESILGLPWEKKDPQVGVQILRLFIDHGLESLPAEFVRRISDWSQDALSVLVTHCLDKSFETFFIEGGLPPLLLRQEWDDPFSKTLKAILNRALLESDYQQDIWESELSHSLSAAIFRNRASAVDVLLSMGATPNTHCLISAAQSDNVHIFKEFLSRGLDPNAHASEYRRAGWGRDRDCTALSESIVNRSKGAFQLLQEQGFVSSLSHQPFGFASAFVAACQAGDSAIIEQLLSMPNFLQSQAGMRKAIEAAIEGHQYHIIEKLLSAGLKPTLESLELALQKRQLTTVILLAKYMELKEATRMRYRPQENAMLWKVLRWGDQTAIEHVLRIGQPVNACDSFVEVELQKWDLLPGVQVPHVFTSWRYTALGAAILGGNTSAVRTLMTYGLQAVSFMAHDTSYHFSRASERLARPGGWPLTPLAAATFTNDLPLIREVLRLGADPFDNCALFICALIDSGDEVVALLLSAFKTRYPYGAQFFGSDALYQAIRRSNTRLLELFVGDIDLTGPVVQNRRSGRPRTGRPNTIFTSPLGEAVRLYAEGQGAGGALDHLLPLVKDFDAIVHKTYKYCSMTSLLYAISLGSLATVRKLHQAGADISLPAEWEISRTPLQAAVQAGSKDIVEYLLNQDVSPNEAPGDQAGRTALQLAAITGNIGIAAVLLDAGAEINAPPAFCDGRTAFEGAAEHGRIEMMMFLVRHGADLLSNNEAQYRRAADFAEINLQPVAKKLAKDLYEQVLKSQVTSFIDMGGDAWLRPDMSSFGGFQM